MTPLNPLSVRAFVAHRQLQRKSRGRFRVATGIVLSLLLHAALLWFALRVPAEPQQGAESSIQAPLMVTLTPSKDKPSAVAPSPLPPEPVRSMTPPKQRPQKAVKRTTPKSAPRPTAPRLPESRTATAAQPTQDMSTMLSAAQARRQEAEAEAASDNAIARESNRAPSGNEVAQANIDFSMHRRKGISGVFEVLSVGPRIGMFRFIGWTGDPSDNTRQTLTVDAGLGGDVETAIIDRMIQLIREHYKEDFNWDSQRLGRVVKLSARQADTGDLRRFMKAEFFETPRY